MIQLYKRMQRMRENYVDTLAKLYEYATTAYAKNQYTQWYNTKEGVTPTKSSNRSATASLRY